MKLSKKVEWNGNWSSNCKNWNEELKELLGFNDDKYIFMTLDDYVNYFNITTIGKCHFD
jgi:hypothetical protein